MKTNFFYNLGKNKLFPIYRSLTGRGNAKTLEIIKRNIGSLKVLKFTSGSKVFDWQVPKEWHVKEAWVKTHKAKSAT